MAVTTVKKVFPLKAGESADKLVGFRYLPVSSEIKCLSPNGEAEIPFRFETGDLLWISTDSPFVWRVCYSYDTKNIYYGSPITGAILICNLMELTLLNADDTDKFAEFLACYCGYNLNIKKFKLGPNKNLLRALLTNIYDDSDKTTEYLVEALHSMTSLFNPMRHFITDLLRNILITEPNAVLLSRIELFKSYYSSLSNTRDAAETALLYENVLTLASRYSGLVEFKGDNFSFSEEGSSFFKDNYGIDLNDGYRFTEPVALKENAKPDRFLKRALLLQKWCKDIK